MNGENRLAFKAEWFNPQSELNVEYTLLYFPDEQAVEMIDVKSKRTFLKKTGYQVDEKELRVGGQVTIYSRLLHIKGYADAYTESILGTFSDSATVIVTVDGFGAIGDIFSALFDSKTATNLRLVDLTTIYYDYNEYQSLSALYKINSPWQFGDKNRRLPFVAVKIIGGNLEATVGHVLQSQLRDGRVLFSSEKKLSDQLFGQRSSYKDVGLSFAKASLCLIKPHLVQTTELLGSFLNSLLSQGHFGFIAMQLFRVEKADAEEFYKVYRGVRTGVQDDIDQLTSGACIAIAVIDPSAADGQTTTVQKLRDFAGPADIEIAKTIAPKSLRALYGKDAVLNAVHVTDLSDDGPLECEYFFNILNS